MSSNQQMPQPAAAQSMFTGTRVLATMVLLALAFDASAQEPPTPPATPPVVPDAVPGNEGDRQKPPELAGAKRVSIETQGTTLRDLVKYFADVTGKNFILPDDGSLKESVVIISHKSVSVPEAYEAFLQALELHGYTTVTVGSLVRIVKSGEAAQTPTLVRQGDNISGTANFVTQIIPLENVSVSELQSVVQSLASPEAKIVAYQPTNTFIITEMSANLKRIYSIITDLDIAAPKSRMQIFDVQYAKAEDIKQLIDDLYGTAASNPSGGAAPATPAARRRARDAAAPDAAAPAAGGTDGGLTAGKESRYISKVIADERTNSLIVIANDEGMQSVRDLLAEIDVDVDPSNRSQIHVIYLENAKAEDVAQVLSNLSENGGSSTTAAPRRRTTTGGAAAAGTPDAAAAGGPTSVTAAFDSGMRITHDESTNSLVIIANSDDFRVVRQVIDQLDIRRRQVLIDAVILELASSDELDQGVAYHGPFVQPDGGVGIAGGQFNASSLGLTQDLLSGLALGVFGPTVAVPFGSTGETLDIPAFGIVVQALRTNSSVDIVSNPQLLTLDNEEAKIVVGRKVPFPTSTSFSQLGTPIVSYQREDVATTLKVTPRVNSSNQVTLEVTVEVAEVEEDNRGLDASQAGFITSKREIETTALVGDNQTVVLGGLVGMTDTTVETKVPILGDIPVLGVLFRGSRVEHRKSNLMVFLTPHIVDDDEDMLEIMKVKEAQRQEFIRRFYGKSRDVQMKELQDLLRYSMNFYGEVPVYSGPDPIIQPEPIGPAEPVRDSEPLPDSP